jgi:hypothetical protein
MKQQRDSKRASNLGLGEAAQITALIIDLRRIDRLIDADIAKQEEEAGRVELSNAAYPIMARILKVRRNNLAKTIASLEARLADLLERPETAVPKLPAI